MTEHEWKNNITVRKQKIRKKSYKSKACLFLVLTALLLFVAAFAKYLCPYDPYAQDLALAQKPPGPEHLLLGQTVMEEIAFPCDHRKYDQYLCNAALVAVITVVGTAIGIFCGWKGKSRYCSDAYLRSVPGFSGTGICPGSSRCSGRRYPECDHCPGSDQLAEVCKTCQRASLTQKDSAYLMAAKLSEAVQESFCSNISFPISQAPSLLRQFLISEP